MYSEVRRKAKDALLRMIEKERDGELVDRVLIKNILGIFIEVRARTPPSRTSLTSGTPAGDDAMHLHTALKSRAGCLRVCLCAGGHGQHGLLRAGL